MFTQYRNNQVWLSRKKSCSTLVREASEKHLLRSPVFSKITGHWPAMVLKINSPTSVSPMIIKPKKKAVLFLEIGWVKILVSFTCPHSQICIRICIFNFKRKKTKTRKQTCAYDIEDDENAMSSLIIQCL